MESRDVCVEAINALVTVVKQIRDEQWDMELPEDFPSMNPDTKPILREIIQALAYDIAWIPDMLSGQTMAEAGEETFKGDLLGDDPQKNFVAIADTSIAAIEAHTDLDSTVRCSYTEYPARNYFTDISGYYGLTAYDLAKALGVRDSISPKLTEGLWELLAPVAEEWRSMGIFGPKVDVPDDADLESRLLGLTGRKP